MPIGLFIIYVGVYFDDDEVGGDDDVDRITTI